MDNHFVNVFHLPWTKVPLRMCTPLEHRVLFHLVVGVQVAAKQVPHEVRPDCAACPFHVQVDRTTFVVRYSRCRYNHLLDGYVRRPALVAAFVDAAFDVATKGARAAVVARARRVFARALRDAASDVDAFPRTHRLFRGLTTLADRMDDAAAASDVAAAARVRPAPRTISAPRPPHTTGRPRPPPRAHPPDDDEFPPQPPNDR
jgi:hypothetical protein